MFLTLFKIIYLKVYLKIIFDFSHIFQLLTDVCSLFFFFSLFLSIKETSVIVIRIRWVLTPVIKATRVIFARMHVRSYQWRINVALERFRVPCQVDDVWSLSLLHAVALAWSMLFRDRISAAHSYITPIRGVHSFTLSQTRQRGEKRACHYLTISTTDF